MPKVLTSELPFVGKLEKPGYFGKELVNIGEYCDSYGALVERDVLFGPGYTKTKLYLADALHLPVKSVEEVMQICSVDNLICEDEPDVDLLKPPPKTRWDDVRRASREVWDRGVADDINYAAATHLSSLAFQKQRIIQLEQDKLARKLFFKQLRYSTEIQLGTVEAHNRVLPMRNFSLAECVVEVRVYRPPPHITVETQSTAGTARVHFCHQITCLGTNTLAQLRDVIQCGNDGLVINNCADPPLKPQIAKDVYRAGYFCINGVFYVDQRQTDTDYSQMVRSWLSEHHYGEYNTESMETTRLRDLTVRVGYPYMYQHQGDCCHLIIISDVRLIHHMDSVKCEYPRLSTCTRRDRSMCEVCDRYVAAWLVMDHELTPTRTVYFCSSCYKQLNFMSGRRKYDFKAFPIIIPDRAPV